MVKITLLNGYFLSEITIADQAAYVEHLKEKEISDHTQRIPYPYTEKDAEAWIQGIQEETKKLGRNINWAIRQPDGYLIGAIGFRNYEPAHKTAEVGYWLAKPYWGKGMMTKVLAAICNYGFSELELTCITAHTTQFNHRSSRLLEKTGFIFNKFKPAHYMKDGKAVDANQFIYAKAKSSNKT